MVTFRRLNTRALAVAMQELGRFVRSDRAPIRWGGARPVLTIARIPGSHCVRFEHTRPGPFGARPLQGPIPDVRAPGDP